MTQCSPGSALLPCPFCGPGQSQVSLWFDDTCKRWRVGCGRCGCSTGTSPRDKTEAPAIEAWNRRAVAQGAPEAPGYRFGLTYGDGYKRGFDDARGAPQAAEERRCQKCGRETKGEEALVDGKILCHPCADDVPQASTDKTLAQALYEAECYGIGATSDTNQRVILQSAKELAALRARPQAASPELRTAAELIVSTFEKDEAQGYRSKDRQFAIDILKMALQADPAQPQAAHRDALEQIAVVCTDNMDADCNHRMALDFVRQIANDALSRPQRSEDR